MLTCGCFLRFFIPALLACNSVSKGLVICRSRPLFDVGAASLLAVAFEHLAEAREGQVGSGAVDQDEPGRDEVTEVVQEVGVGDAVDGGAHGEEEH